MGGSLVGLRGQGAPVLSMKGSLQGGLLEVKGGLEGHPALLDPCGRSEEATSPPRCHLRSLLSTVLDVVHSICY